MKFNLNNETELVKRFNRKERDAFACVYDYLYDALYLFSSHLFASTEVGAEDVIHDIFLNILNSKELKFSSLEHIKSYIYHSVRNSFKRYYEHKKYVDEYTLKKMQSDDYIDSEMIESEFISILNDMIKTLPLESGKVISLLAQGMTVKEIAKKLNRKESTVYDQKTKAITALKNKYKGSIFYILISLLN